MNNKNNFEYNPMYFLSALGAGGTSVMFFMYLMFMTKHNTPIPTFNTLLSYFTGDINNILFQALIIISVLGIVYFAYKHYSLVIWNIKNFNKFKKTKDFNNLIGTNKEVQLMAYPLTLAMSINVAFILGAVSIPNIWNIIEYLFPIALLSFGAVGIFAIKVFTKYMSRIISNKSFSFDKNNNFSQMLGVFAFVMVGVGFAASAAMSHNKITVSIALIFSIFFIIIAILFGLVQFILGFKSILRNGLDKETSPTIWIIIPFLTLIGITIVRQTHGLEYIFDMHFNKGFNFILTVIIISIQVMFGYIGYKVMQSNNYFKEYIYGDKKSSGSYSLICPGVAFVVFAFFFIHLGLVKPGIIEKFSVIYFIVFTPILYIKYKTIQTYLKLNNKLL